MTDSNANFVAVGDRMLCCDVVGSGPNVVLLIPGGIGTASTDFPHVLDAENGWDRNLFTLVAVEPPGIGRSSPPERMYDRRVYDDDSLCYRRLMEELNYDKYSIVGLSDGAKVALLMAIKYSDRVESVVLVNYRNSVTNDWFKELITFRSMETWNETKLDRYLKVYDTFDNVVNHWNQYLAFVQRFRQYFPKDMFGERYVLATCPVLITYTIPLSNETRVLYGKLPNVASHQFCSHSLEPHNEHAARFKKEATKFILDRHNMHVDQEKLMKKGGDNIGLMFNL